MVHAYPGNAAWAMARTHFKRTAAAAHIYVHPASPSHPSWADERGGLAAGGQLWPCPERSALAQVASILRTTSALANASATNLACCAADAPEPRRMGRCASFADQGLCGTWFGYCPVACEGCLLCSGHALLPLYLKLFKRMRHPPRGYTNHTKSGLRVERAHQAGPGTESTLTGTRLHGLSTQLKTLAVFRAANPESRAAKTR